MNHPLTPPPELVQQWLREWNTLGVRHANPVKSTSYVAIEAAQWGADQELEACCDAITKSHAYGVQDAEWLRDARRPKPLSLKAQALTALHAVATGANDTREQHQDLDTIRRALEALPND
jgi:hypothetical protein